jgi:predicted RNA binding protein YcfA (HicA-like mRNA interferase family)
MILWTFILVCVGILVVLGSLAYKRHSEDERIQLVQDTLNDNISYHWDYKSRTVLYRVKEILWEQGGFKLILTRKGSYALVKHDKTLVLAQDKGEMFKVLVEQIGVKEAIKAARQLGWKLNIVEK